MHANSLSVKLISALFLLFNISSLPIVCKSYTINSLQANTSLAFGWQVSLNELDQSIKPHDSTLFNWIGTLTLTTENIEMSQRALETIVQFHQGSVVLNSTSQTDDGKAHRYKVKIPTALPNEWVEQLVSIGDSMVSNALLPIPISDIDIHLAGTYAQIQSEISKNEIRFQQSNNKLEREVLQKFNQQIIKELSKLDSVQIAFNSNYVNTEFDLILIEVKNTLLSTRRAENQGYPLTRWTIGYGRLLEIMAPICLLLAIIGVSLYSYKKWKGMG